MKFDFDDVLIQPATQTHIDSRYADINPYVGNGFLPLFTAPMDTVINSNNSKQFIQNKINVVYPRTEKYKNHANGFNSFSYDEFLWEISQMGEHDGERKVLIDVANGHMEKIISAAKLAKLKNPKIIIMAGNIASPHTYRLYCMSNAIDYVRIGIGNGNGCLTTQQTGIGFPMGSLISECYEIKKSYRHATKIVADGGMKKYSDIIKALALGADYVMVGSILNKALESASDNYWHSFKLSNSIAKFMYQRGYTLHKEFRGMSSKKSQLVMGNTVLRTSEGVVKRQNVEYTLQQWSDNFESYLRSAMSYTDCRSLPDFMGNVKYNLITENSFNRYNK